MTAVHDDQSPRKASSARNIFPVRPSTKVALVGGFKPTKCGIATFTTDVFEQMQRWLPHHSVQVYAMIRDSDSPVSSEATATIVQHDVESYRAAARQMNADAVDVVWIQHEFGIYGGECGRMVLELIDAVAAPIVITLHTVLKEPSPQQREIVDRMHSKATRFVVMSKAGRDILVSTYGVDPKFIQIVEHGAPDRPHVDPRDVAAAGGREHRPSIMTFGLLGPGKGLETAIRALPAILREQPDVIYRIVGATHPNLVAQEGERYRDDLKALAGKLGVNHAIEWVERFLDTDELLDQLSCSDIYLTPYPNLAQSTSGTLSYAVALGCAVISTPYIHARELLADDVGIIVPPNDPEKIAEAAIALFSDREQLQSVRERAYDRGRRTIWSEFAARCGEIIADVQPRTIPASAAVGNLKRPSFDSFLSLVDDVGIIQHARGIVPDRHHGYSIDDNARALILVNELGTAWHPLAVRFAAFLEHAWNRDERRFRNFMSYDRRWLEPVGSQDSNGRAVWAIGHTASRAHDAKLRGWALDLFTRCTPAMLELGSPRTLAFLALGAQKVLEADRHHVAALRLLEHCADGLRPLSRPSGSDGWKWCEDSLSYDNVRIPQALLAIANCTGERALGEGAIEQLSWLCKIHTTPKGLFRPVGSETFGLEKTARPYDQQPLEAWAMIDACAAAAAFKPSEEWRAMAIKAYAWYLGCNDMGVALGDVATGVCHDGLMATGLNQNTGAESVLSFSLAFQSLSGFVGVQGEHAENAAYSRPKASTH